MERSVMRNSLDTPIMGVSRKGYMTIILFSPKMVDFVTLLRTLVPEGFFYRTRSIALLSDFFQCRIFLTIVPTDATDISKW